MLLLPNLLGVTMCILDVHPVALVYSKLAKKLGTERFKNEQSNKELQSKRGSSCVNTWQTNVFIYNPDYCTFNNMLHTLEATVNGHQERHTPCEKMV
jgi:hypothetical protein